MAYVVSDFPGGGCRETFVVAHTEQDWTAPFTAADIPNYQYIRAIIDRVCAITGCPLARRV